MITELIFLLMTLIFAILIGLPLASAITSLMALLTGRYLNRYFVVSKKSKGVYELHHQPVLGFYMCNNRKLYRLTKDAIERFQVRYPGCVLMTMTLTIQSGNRQGSQVQLGSFRLLVSRLMADFLILYNLATHR